MITQKSFLIKVNPIDKINVYQHLHEIVHVNDANTYRPSYNRGSVSSNLQNLVTNAINYNDKAKGVIEIGFEDQNDFWQFYIKDNGKGMGATLSGQLHQSKGLKLLRERLSLLGTSANNFFTITLWRL